jgi:hypothetical protein
MKTNTIRNCAKTVAFFSLLLCVRHGWSATFSLNPGVDAFVTAGPSGNLSNNNYGGAGALSVAAPSLSQGEFQSVLQFGLSGAKSSFDTQFGAGQWSVQSVTLQLTAASPNNAIFNASAAGQFGVSLMLNNSWTEGTGTPQSPTTTGITFSTISGFESAMDEALGTFSYSGTTGGSTTYTLNLSLSLSADILAGGTVSLRMLAEDSSVSYLFDSRNFGTASSRPLLTIDAVPEPGAITLSLLGLGLFAFSKRGLCRWRR